MKKELIILASIITLFSGCGEETKKEVTHAVEQVKEKSTPMLEKITDAVSPQIEQIKKVIDEKTPEVKKLVEDKVAQVKEQIHKATAPSKDPKQLFAVCAGCHGVDASKHALGKSAIIKGWSSSKIETALNGYKDGTYGGAMKGVMKGQVAKLSSDDIKVLI